MNSLTYIEKKLKDSGCKLTEQRRLIIEIFEETPGHYTAQEIFEKAKEKCDSINFSTIYRNLELLSKLKIIHKLYLESGISHFEMSRIGHHHHIVCKSCGKMQEIEVCLYDHIAHEKLEEIGFEATEHKFEIYGYCRRCRG